MNLDDVNKYTDALIDEGITDFLKRKWNKKADEAAYIRAKRMAAIKQGKPDPGATLVAKKKASSNTWDVAGAIAKRNRQMKDIMGESSKKK